MQRTNTQEILDSKDCPRGEMQTALRDLGRINRWFGGVTTTRKLLERVVSVTGRKRLSLLEVAAGLGEVPRCAALQLARHGVSLEITNMDRDSAHLERNHHALAGDALALPFGNGSFDIVGCSLFAHHLEPAQLKQFASEALRVSRHAVVINDIIRHPLHLLLVYAGFPLMRSYVSRVDGVASVRRAYVPAEMRTMLANGIRSADRVEISTHYLFRMGVIVWKNRSL